MWYNARIVAAVRNEATKPRATAQPATTQLNHYQQLFKLNLIT
jgi:hypothetical protein